MKMVDAGRRVRIHYIGRLEDGSVFEDSYQEDKPLEFIVGARQVIPGLDKAVSEMSGGEKRTVHVPAALGYGDYRADLIETVPFGDFPNAERLPVSEYISMSTGEGVMRVKVLKIQDGLVHFDHNHELAGRDLDFEVELLEVYGSSGTIIENERYMTGVCGCGCDEMRAALGHRHEGDCVAH
jgi:FKBP-type peptidyl-prolyl cis-trans isomerase 2